MQNSRNDAQPLEVSLLEPGASVSLANVAEVAPAAPETCLQLVVFSPDCPFCQRAADREAKELTETSRSARLWFTDAQTATLPYFVSEHLRRDPAAQAINFQLNLPTTWNGKALQYGGGGFNGVLITGLTPLRDAAPDDALPIARGHGRAWSCCTTCRGGTSGAARWCASSRRTATTRWGRTCSIASVRARRTM